MDSIKEENYYIDFIRFLCGLIIMCFHSWVFSKEGNSFFINGYLAVNFYFVLTGYLMMNSLDKYKKETHLFIWGKIKRLLPGILLTFLVSYIFVYGKSSFFINKANITRMLSNENIGELFQLRIFGYGSSINASWWYISAMLFDLAILYPLAKKFEKKYITYIAPMIILIVLAITNFYKISFSSHGAITLIFSNGFYKGLVYICLGNISYKLHQIIKFKYKNQKILLTIIEILLTAIMLYQFYTGIIGSILLAIIMMLLISISFSGNSLTHKVFKHKIWKSLGNYSFYLYLIHVAIRQYYQRHNTYVYLDMFIKYALTSMLVALIVYIILDIIYPKSKKFFQKNC